MSAAKAFRAWICVTALLACGEDTVAGPELAHTWFLNEVDGQRLPDALVGDLPGATLTSQTLELRPDLTYRASTVIAAIEDDEIVRRDTAVLVGVYSRDGARVSLLEPGALVPPTLRSVSGVGLVGSTALGRMHAYSPGLEPLGN